MRVGRAHLHHTSHTPPSIIVCRYDFMPRNVSALFFPPDAAVHAGFFKVFYKARYVSIMG